MIHRRPLVFLVPVVVLIGIVGFCFVRETPSREFADDWNRPIPAEFLPLTDAGALELAKKERLGLSIDQSIEPRVDRIDERIVVRLPLWTSGRYLGLADDWISVWFDETKGCIIRSPNAISQTEAFELAKKAVADIAYDKSAEPSVERGSSVFKVTFWQPPDPELPGKTFFAAIVWVNAETGAVIETEVAED